MWILARAASTLGLIFVGVVALIGQWAVESPWPAVLVLCGLVWLWKRWRDFLRERSTDDYVPLMSPVDYERYAARLLSNAGWKVRHVGSLGDQGCDVLAELRGFRAVIQCKLYRKRAGNDAVQQIVAARRHYNAQIMVVVCPSGFTQSAHALAASNHVHLMHHSTLPSLERLARIPNP